MDRRLNTDSCLSSLQAMNFIDSFTDWNLVNCSPSNYIPIPQLQPRLLKGEGDLHEDSDFSDLVLKYINQMLMEEDIDDKNCMFQESAALQAAQKSFYNALLLNDQDQGYCQQNTHQDLGQLQINDGQHQDNIVIAQDKDNTVIDQDQDHGQDEKHGQNPGEELFNDIGESTLLPNRMISFDSRSSFQPSYSLFSSARNIVDGFLYSPVSILTSPDLFSDNRFNMQFQNSMSEASSFLTNGRSLDFKGNGVLDQTMENKHEISFIRDGSRGKKNIFYEEVIEDGRSFKHSAVYSEPVVSSKMFDDVLLCGGPKTHPFQCDFVCKKYAIKGQPKGCNGVKGRARKQKEAVDLRTLLSLCAQSVSINDQRGATELLKRIREHASPTGDGMQRLAHYFSAGLEARMAGSGTRIYKDLVSIPISAVDVLKAYRLFLGCFPFTKIFHFVSNKTIMSIAQNKPKLHIIDFGILHGFQWPCLIQQLSSRPGGPPELRITGVDFPCPGFRPTQRVEETGQRLANYAKSFGMQFKFKAIAQKWETIRIEDLDLDDDETLVVNCGYRFRNLLDETVMVDSPRKKVLHLIRKMNPKIFIHGIVNGSYGVPFFLTRFREALFFFSSLFDMLDATVDCLTEERMLIEKTMWGREAMNVIACEDGERIERPETYKQWHVRTQRAGFHQVAFDKEIMDKAKDRGSSDYHKDFLIDEDGCWMLQGWKGRVLYAISSWKPAC